MSERSEYAVAVDPDASNNPHSAAIRMVGSDRQVLEVGCWSGHVTEHLVARGNTVVGVEIDPEAAAVASAYTERIHVADIDTTPLTVLESGPFDVVMLCDVLEHLKRPDVALADACRLLTPGGRVVVSVPNVAHVDVRAMLAGGEWRYQDDGVLDRTHLRWFTRRSLRELLDGAGLTAVAIERVRTPFGTSNHLPDPHTVPAALVEHLLADPEATTLQYVVAAERETDDSVDALADAPEISWPALTIDDGTAAAERGRLAAVTAERDALRHEVGALATQRDALHNEVDAWHRSRLVRLTAPLRALRRR